MKYSVLVLATEPDSPDEVLIFPSTGDWEVDCRLMEEYAHEHGYTQPYDHWVFPDVSISHRSVLGDRSRPGRFA